jgi:hypothetical protein
VLVYADVDRGIVKQVVIEPQEAAWGGPWILFHTGATKAGGAAGKESKQHQAKEGKYFAMFHFLPIYVHAK